MRCLFFKKKNDLGVVFLREKRREYYPKMEMSMLIALFFGIRYSFTGEDDLASANELMEKAGDMADEVRSEFVG